MLITILAFIFTLGVIVTIHEYGHFQMARWCGVKVLKFSIGFGKPLWRKTFGKDQTEFVIAAIPLGGFVKMLGEDGAEGQQTLSPQDQARAFSQQHVLKRMAIVIAGPLANLLLAIVLYWGILMTGVVGIKPIIGSVVAHSPAATANIQPAETIQSINGVVVHSWQEVSWLILKESLNTSTLSVQTLDSAKNLHTYQLDLAGVKLEDGDVLAKLGLTMYRAQVPAKIGAIEENSPASQAGLKPDDLVLTVNHQPVDDWEMFVNEVRLHPNQKIALEVQRAQEKLTLMVVPNSVAMGDTVIGRIGAAFKLEEAETSNPLIFTSYLSPAEALVKAVEKTWDTARFSLIMLKKMLIGEASLKGISGPVSIADYAGQSAQIGFKALIGFMALISISIGVLNLLPIPILDGGHLVYYIVEFFTGRPVSDAVVNAGQRLGIMILGCLMLLALYNDMNRLLTG